MLTALIALNLLFLAVCLILAVFFIIFGEED